MDKNTADLIVVPLFLFGPVLTLRLVKLSDYFEAFFVAVVPKPVFEKGLVEVEPLECVLLRVWVFLEEFVDKMPRLVLFLDEAEYLVDLVGNNVSILIHLILQGIFSISLKLRQIILVCLPFRDLLLSSIELLLWIS